MKTLFGLLVAIVSTTAFAGTNTIYICDSREVLTGKFTVGSGTKVEVDEENRTATVLGRPTVPNADWTVVYTLNPENEYGRERFTSGKELQDLDVLFSRVGTYMVKPGPHSPEPAVAGALVYKFSNGLNGTTTRVYLCSKKK